jgi:hypothetical protein
VRLGQLKNLLLSPLYRYRRVYPVPVTAPFPAIRSLSGLYEEVGGVGSIASS